MTAAVLPFARLWHTHRREVVGFATLGAVGGRLEVTTAWRRGQPGPPSAELARRFEARGLCPPAALR